MQVANLRFLLRNNAVISCLEQDSLPYFKQRITQYVSIKNDEKILQKSPKNSISNPLIFTRYNFTLNGLDYIIENYDFCDTCVLEVRFNLADEIIEYKMPDFLSAHCIQNITNDENYEKISLALFGKPNYHFEFSKILQKSKLLRIFWLYSPGQISAYDGVRIHLYGILEQINTTILQYLDKKNPKLLFEISELLEQNTAILSTFKDIFDEKIIGAFEGNFQNIQIECRELGKKSFLNDYIKRHNIAFKGFKELSKQVEKQSDETLLRLLDFQNLLKEWGFVLEDANGFYSLEAGKMELKSFAAKKLCDFIDDFVNSKNSKDFYYILKAFGYMFHYKISAKILKKLSKIIEYLEHNQKCAFLSTELDIAQMKTINQKLNSSLNKTSKKIEKKHKKITKLVFEFSEILQNYKSKQGQV